MLDRPPGRAISSIPMRNALAIAACTAVVLAATPPAAADEAQKAAKQHFNAGVKLYKSDDFTGALAEFLKAYELKPHYAVLYNIANCQKNLEYYSEALVNFERYLDEGGSKVSDPRRKQVEEDIEEILELLSQVTLGSDVEGAAIMIDGKEIGMTPHLGAIYLDAGKHLIRIEKESFEDWEKEIILSRGEKASIEVHMVEIAVEPEPEPELEPEPEPRSPELVEGEPEPQPEPQLTKKKLRPRAFYAVMGVTMGIFSLSAVTGVSVLLRKSEFYSMAANDPNLDKFIKTTRTLALATDVLWGIAGAGIITMIILGVKTDFKKKKNERLSFLLCPTIGSDGVGFMLELEL